MVGVGGLFFEGGEVFGLDLYVVEVVVLQEEVFGVLGLQVFVVGIEDWGFDGYFVDFEQVFVELQFECGVGVGIFVGVIVG